jgi:hypothetical protein
MIVQNQTFKLCPGCRGKVQRKNFRAEVKRCGCGKIICSRCGMPGNVCLDCYLAENMPKIERYYGRDMLYTAPTRVKA